MRQTTLDASNVTLRIALLSAAAVVALALRFFAVSSPVGAQTGSLLITSAPSVAAQEITAVTAVVRWTTNVSSIGRVYYGETAALGSSWSKLEGIGPEESEVSESAHVIRLEELKPATTYFYKVWSKDAAGAEAESAQSSFTTAASAVASLDSILLSSPATGAKLKSPVTFGGRVIGTASAVTFTYSSSSAAPCIGKRDNDSGTEQNWSCGPVTLAAGDYSVSAAAVGVDAAGVATTKTSVSINFTVEPSCADDVWECVEWGACLPSTAGYFQNRVCVLKTDCPSVAAPAKPATTQACTPPCTADVWSCGPWGSCAKDTSGRQVQSRSCTLKLDCPAVETPKPETTQICLPAPGCTADVWSCGEWSSCAEPGTTTKKRTCELTMDCPTATTPRPEDVADCPAPCKEDLWTCTDWGKCDKTNNERRICTKDLDCPNVDTPKPSEARECMLPSELDDKNAPTVSECEPGAWRCDDWRECNAYTSTQSRACALPGGCTASERSPETAQACTPAKTCVADNWACTSWDAACPAIALGDEAQVLRRSCILKDDCPGVDTAKPSEEFRCDTLPTLRLGTGNGGVERPGSGGAGVRGRETADEGASTPSGDTRASAVPNDYDPKFASLYLDPDAAAKYGELLRQTCYANGIDAERCVAWLDAKYANKACKDAGLYTRDACRDFLARRGGGGEPGCQVMQTDDCNAQFIAWLLQGRLGQAVKSDADALLEKGIDAGVVPVLPGLLAVSDKGASGVSLRPAGEGGVGAPAIMMRDADRDGVPDDIERARGTDPENADSDSDGTFDGEEMKNGTDPTGKGQQPKDLSPVEKALVHGVPLQQPRGAGEVDSAFELQLAAHDAFGNESDYSTRGAAGKALKIESIAIKQSGAAAEQGAGDGAKRAKFSGKAVPNSTVILYVYSYVPMVMTATTDADGNFTVEIEGDVLAEGEHEMYVAVTDETGKIEKKSNPLAFFVKEAQAVSEEEYLEPDFVPITEPIRQWQQAYLIGTVVAVVLALGAAWFLFGRKLGETPPPPQQPQQ